MNQQSELCSICGGDGRIANAFGSTTTCPSCHGGGRRVETTGFHDVTKTKPSHYKAPPKPAGASSKDAWPTSPSGMLLANEVKNSVVCAADVKARLIREIIDHESTHGDCTQTFI
ncbi:MAG TPA: molecular chaperone DnaJ, partial [Polyangiaceae bacterium]|nr:molecular chaperone DnaJ [Polyangiaceae bacterium]